MVLAWNEAHVAVTLQVAKALRLELKKSDNDVSSVLVQAQRRVAGAVLSARAMSQLAMGHLWLATLDAEAAVDCSPESPMTHVRMGEVYEAAGGGAAAVRCFQRASALSPNSHSISQRLETARGAPSATTPTVADAALQPAGSNPSSVFDVSLEKMDAEWESTGLTHIKRHEWFDFRRKACPHGVLLAVTDAIANNEAWKRATESSGKKKIADADADADADAAEHGIASSEYVEKELFCERAMSLYAKKRHSGAPLPEGSTWLDLAFEAVNIDALTPLEQAKICMCMGNVFAWCADFSGADELYTFALEMDDLETSLGALARWRPALLANRSLCRLRLGRLTDAAVDAETSLREAGARWGRGLSRMGQVMCSLGAWSKAEQTFRVGHERSNEALELKVKIALASTGGMGLPAAREAGEKAVAAVKAAKELEAIGDLLDHLDTVVQLDALVPDADVDPIPGPTPRFLAEVTEGMTDDHSPASASASAGKVNPLGRAGQSLSEELGALDALHSTAATTTTTTTTTASKKRARERGGQEVDSLRGGVEGMTVEEEAAALEAEEAEEHRKRGRARYASCGVGCGDFFHWASGGLFGTPSKPDEEEGGRDGDGDGGGDGGGAQDAFHEDVEKDLAPAGAGPPKATA